MQKSAICTALAGCGACRCAASLAPVAPDDVDRGDRADAHEDDDASGLPGPDVDLDAVARDRGGDTGDPVTEIECRGVVKRGPEGGAWWAVGGEDAGELWAVPIQEKMLNSTGSGPGAECSRLWRREARVWPKMR